MHEKDVFPIVRNTMNLLKRVSAKPSNLDADEVVLQKTLNTTADAMAGEYMYNNKLVIGLKNSILKDYFLNGTDVVNKSVADDLYNAFNEKMCEYFM